MESRSPREPLERGRPARGALPSPVTRPVTRRTVLVLALGAVLLPGALACVPAPPFIESTTRLSSTRDRDGPYVVQSVVSDALPDDAVELRYRVVGDPRFIPLLMVEDEDGERFSAGIPGRPAGTSIQYYVTVIRDGTRVADDPAAAGAGPYQFDIQTP